MAGKQVKALTKAQALIAADRYAEVDDRGRRKWSIMRLAADYEVSETTMFRAINRLGSYRDVPEPLPPADSPEMKAAAAESFARVQALMQESNEHPSIDVLLTADSSAQAKMLKDINKQLGIEETAVRVVKELSVPKSPLDE